MLSFANPSVVEPQPATSEVVNSVPCLDPAWHERAVARLNCLTKPLGSLGRLEEIAARLVQIRETEQPHYFQKAIFTMAADHGVTEEVVSAYPKEVTMQMVLNFLSRGAAINVLCRQFGIDIVVVDIGVDSEPLSAAGLVNKKVGRGTKNMARGAAMTESEVEAAFRVGIDLAFSVERKKALIGIGEMGIGNTTAASAISGADWPTCLGSDWPRYGHRRRFPSPQDRGG